MKASAGTGRETVVTERRMKARIGLSCEVWKRLCGVFATGLKDAKLHKG
jgi:hypothetical protein